MTATNTMTRTNKILLGLATFSPIIFILLYFVVFIGMFASIATTAQLDSPEPPAALFGFFPFAFLLIFLAIIFSIGTLIYYIVHIVNNPKFKLEEHKNMQIVWILIVLFANGIGSMVYYFVEIWPLPEPEKGALKAQ